MLLLQLYALLLAILFTSVSILLLKREEKMRLASKEREGFTNMMVHELRAPLIAVKDAAIYLRDKHGKVDYDQEAKFLRIITDQSNHLLDEIATLLDAAKLGAGKFSVHKVQTDMIKLITDQVQIFSSQAENKHMVIDFVHDDKLPLAPVDPIRMSQVFNNLLSNSIKYTQDGGKITVSATSSGPLMQVKVTDTGIGIEKDKQKLLFSEFVQAHDPNVVGVRFGTGLGLYITKGIVEAHGGNISLQSEVNQGTTITFTLPLGGLVESPKLSNSSYKQYPLESQAHSPAATV